MLTKIIGYIMLAAGCLIPAVNNNTPGIHIPMFISLALISFGAWLLYRNRKKKSAI